MNKVTWKCERKALIDLEFNYLRDTTDEFRNFFYSDKNKTIPDDSLVTLKLYSARFYYNNRYLGRLNFHLADTALPEKDDFSWRYDDDSEPEIISYGKNQTCYDYRVFKKDNKYFLTGSFVVRNKSLNGDKNRVYLNEYYFDHYWEADE